MTGDMSGSRPKDRLDARRPVAGGRFLRDLRDGLISPGAWAVGIASAMLLCFAVLAVSLLTPERVIRSGHLLMTGGQDHNLAVTQRVLRLATEPSDRPSIWLLGSSRIRSSIDLPQLERAMGSGRTVGPFMSGLQTPIDMLTIVENLPDSPPATVVIEAHPWNELESRLLETVREPRVGLRSEAADAVIRKAGGSPRPRWNNFLLDNLAFYLGRLPLVLPNAIAGDRFRSMEFLGRPVPDDRKWKQKTLLKADAFRDQFARTLEFQRPILEEVLDRLQARPETRVVLAFSVPNPRWVSDYRLETEYARFRTWIEGIAAARDITTIDLADGVELQPVPGHFCDEAHVRDPALVDALTRNLARKLQEVSDDPR